MDKNLNAVLQGQSVRATDALDDWVRMVQVSGLLLPEKQTELDIQVSQMRTAIQRTARQADWEVVEGRPFFG